MRTVLVFLFSLAMYHWCLDEIALFSPEAADYTRGLTEQVRFPTHDRWPVAELGDLLQGELGVAEFLNQAWRTVQSDSVLGSSGD